VARAGCDIIITGSVKKVAAKYGPKAQTFTILEVGHVAQNILLQVVALNLAAVPIGAFDVDKVKRLCGLPSELELFYIISIGHPASTVLMSKEMGRADLLKQKLLTADN
jgi:SagB-type dehydrogenase family enzyme